MTKEAYKTVVCGFGTESGRMTQMQTEDIGDNAMKASAYGIKNLKRIFAKNLIIWSAEMRKLFRIRRNVQCFDRAIQTLYGTRD